MFFTTCQSHLLKTVFRGVQSCRYIQVTFGDSLNPKSPAELTVRLMLLLLAPDASCTQNMRKRQKKKTSNLQNVLFTSRNAYYA